MEQRLAGNSGNQNTLCVFAKRLALKHFQIREMQEDQKETIRIQSTSIQMQMMFNCQCQRYNIIVQTTDVQF